MLMAFITSRLMVFGVIVMSGLQVPPGPFSVRGDLLTILSTGDAAGYANMVQTGRWVPFAADSDSGLFPVFPVLLKLVSLLFGNVALAGVVIANVCLLAAGILLYQLLRSQHDDPRISRNAVMLLMFNPASYFLTAAGPDSAALALAVASMLAATKGRWIIAAACGVLLCGTIPAGYWIAVPLTCEYVRQGHTHNSGESRLLRPEGLLLALVFIPLAAAITFGLLKFGDPLAYLKVSPWAEARLGSLLRMSRYFDGYASFYEWIFRGTVFASVVICVAGFALKVRSSYVAFAVILTLVCFWFHDLQAPRTLMLSFPLFAIMGVLVARYKALYEPLLTGSMVLLALFTLAAANGYWIH